MHSTSVSTTFGAVSIHRNQIHAILYTKDDIVWAYLRNEYHRCRIIELVHPIAMAGADTTPEGLDTPQHEALNENEATPPLKSDHDAIETLSDCSTPPLSPVSAPPTTTQSINATLTELTDHESHEGLCTGSVPVYRVLCLNPRYKEDLACKYLCTQQRCPFQLQNKCKFSHGWLAPQDRIKAMSSKDTHYTLCEKDRCLAKWQHDQVWYKGRIESIHLLKSNTVYTVRFDHFAKRACNVDKHMIVTYTSKLDAFYDCAQPSEDKIVIAVGDSADIESSLSNSAKIGHWQCHTTGIGMKYLSKFGYKVGDGLGKHKQGRAQPIPIKKMARNAGLGVVRESMTPKRKRKRNQASVGVGVGVACVKKKKKKNVFDTMNCIFSSDCSGRDSVRYKSAKVEGCDGIDESKLKRISELLFSLESERSMYSAKLNNTRDATMKIRYQQLVDGHTVKIKRLRMKQSMTESKRNQDAMYSMEKFKF